MRGIVDQDVDAAQLGQRLVDDAAAMVRILYVAGNDNGLSPGLVHKPLGLLGILVLAQVGNEDVRPFPCKKASATARPIPLSAPVMIAFLSTSRPDPR